MMKTTVALTLTLWSVLAASCAGADWQPADGPLSTRWTKDVTPEHVWPEYPRPQLVRPQWTNLNGLWDYAIRPKTDGQPDQWDGKILVPFAAESALSGVMKPVKPDQRLWYHRTFRAPELSGGRLLLHFGAVDWESTVWLNGQQVGHHTGGYDPFTLDITDAMRNGDNQLVVSVWDPTDEGDQPRGKQVLKPGGIMYTAVTGIWQTVWLEPVPGNFVQSLKVVPDLDRSLVQVTVSSSGGGTARLQASFGGQRVIEGDGPVGQAISLRLASPRRWSPDEPNLYDLRVVLVDQGRDVDTVDSYFGMRKIEVAPDAQGIHRLLLNGQVLFQYGPLDQGWWPDGLYTPATDEAMKYDIVMTKQFGMNMARKHVKYEPARWYYWCDKLGLMVWQDMPAGRSEHTDQSKADFRRELQAMIDALHHFPSIVMWVPFNEGWGQFDTPQIVQWLQHYDPTRPVNEASGWNDKGSGAVSDMHSYPGPGMRPVEKNRVCVLGEFGGLGMPVPGHTWQAEKNWGYVSFNTAQELTDAYVGLLTRMRLLIGQGLSAAVYTQTSDVEIEVNGLMTYDRQVVKMDLDRIAQAARKLYLPPPRVETLVPTSQSQPQTWRYTFQQPASDWSQTAFDDAAWQAGPGGFGTKSTPGAVVGTVWNGSDIWLRREFQLNTATGDNRPISLMIHHDEDAEVYVNGQLVSRLKGHVTGYNLVPVDLRGAGVLQPGRNVLAVHCHQTTGGQFIDLGLAVVVEQPESGR